VGYASLFIFLFLHKLLLIFRFLPTVLLACSPHLFLQSWQSLLLLPLHPVAQSTTP